MVDVGVVAVTVFALLEGADPTLVGPLGVLALARPAGGETAHAVALLRAVAGRSDGDGGSNT